MKIYYKILISSGLLLCFLVASGALNIYLSLQISKSSDWHNRSMEVIRMTTQLEKNIIDQETGMRGYLLTGHDTFLQPYNNAQVRIPVLKAKLDSLLAQSPEQHKRVQDVMDIHQIWHDSIFVPSESMAKSIGPQESFTVLHYIVSNKLLLVKGKKFMDGIRARFKTILQNEDAIRAERENALKRSILISRIFNILFIIFAIVTAILGAYYISAGVRGRLKPLSEAAQRIAGGDYSLNIPNEKPDELQPIISSFNEMAHSLNLAFNRLQQNITDLEQFNWITSHDLKEPLRIASLYFQLLERKNNNFDEESQGYIDYIKLNIRRMHELINSLLEFSKVDKNEVKLEVVNTRQLVNRVVENLQQNIYETHARIEIGFLPEEISAIGFMLGQVFQNLIQNALKFAGPEPPLVKIEAKDDGDHWTFTVKDNGIGIDDEYKDKVFVIFKRLHNTETYPGTGIGLAICRKVIEKHNGTISFRSKPGKGTEFYFTIPKVVK